MIKSLVFSCINGFTKIPYEPQKGIEAFAIQPGANLVHYIDVKLILEQSNYIAPSTLSWKQRLRVSLDYNEEVHPSRKFKGME